MPKITYACDICGSPIDAVFNPETGVRTVEVIDGEMHVTDQCFVADEIHFNGNGRLIFVPYDKEAYYEEYFVVCRKLFITKGHDPISAIPYPPGDPGRMYVNNNVITWEDRLCNAGAGADPPKAEDGTSYDRNTWGSSVPPPPAPPHGLNGGDGDDGDVKNVNNGQDGRDAPSVVVLALEVKIGPLDHLTIDFDGQNGGQGSRGQDGGDGGTGMGGLGGSSDTGWPGTGCNSQPGNGGVGGNGGDGCRGGDGGKGGNAGDITIISISDNISREGPFVTGRIHYVNDGGDGGEGGFGGKGGLGALGGRPGPPSTHCDKADKGERGIDGEPKFADTGSQYYKGAGGPRGAGGSLDYEDVEWNTCADSIPRELEVLSLTPNSGSRGDTVSVTIRGTDFDTSALSYNVTVSGLGVTTGKIVIEDSTTITCEFIIGPAAPATSRDVTVRIGASQATLPNSFTVTT